MTEGLTAEAVLDPAAVLRVHFTRNNFYDRGHCQECRAEFPCVPAQLARQLLAAQERVADLLYQAILDELVVLWGEPSDAVSTQVRPIVARNIVDRYAALAALAEHTETPG